MNKELKKDVLPKLIKDLGRRYPTPESKTKYRYGLYECPYCAKEFEANMYIINHGVDLGCGCRRGKSRAIHNLSNNKFYKVWTGLVNRCGHLKSKLSKDCKLSVEICDDWMSPTTFVAWCESTHPKRRGMTLGRIDNTKAYSPNNCAWVGADIRAVNQRMKGNNTSGYTGVFWDCKLNKWRAYINFSKKRVNLGSFHKIWEAVQSRDNYILDNKLPHKLSTDYIKETK